MYSYSLTSDTKFFIKEGSIPDYAIYTGNGKFIWRTYYWNSSIPFLNGSHYFRLPIKFLLQRQDPYGHFGLLFNGNENGQLGDKQGEYVDDASLIYNNNNVDLC